MRGQSFRVFSVFRGCSRLKLEQQICVNLWPKQTLLCLLCYLLFQNSDTFAQKV